MIFQKTISFFYKAQKYTTLSAFHESFSHKVFGCIEIHGDAMTVVRLKMVLIFHFDPAFCSGVALLRLVYLPIKWAETMVL